MAKTWYVLNAGCIRNSATISMKSDFGPEHRTGPQSIQPSCVSIIDSHTFFIRLYELHGPDFRKLPVRLPTLDAFLPLVITQLLRILPNGQLAHSGISHSLDMLVLRIVRLFRAGSCI
jgi:hypothetical protein